MSMKKIIKITAIVLAVLLVLLMVLANLIYYFVIKSDSSKDAIFSFEQNQIDVPEIEDKDRVEVKFDDEEITSHDGLKLHGYSIEQDTDVWVIGIHGYTDNGIVVGQLCGGFYFSNMSILLPDLRGQGKSEGDYIAFGWEDRLDILSWIDYLNEKYDNPDIILYGVSMGASCALMASGEDLPENVRCIISDSAYTSIKDEFEYEAKTLLHLPYYPVVWAASMVTKVRAGYSFEEGDALAQVKKSSTPTLFIHGTKDTFVPETNMLKLYDACSAPKAKYEGIGSEHCMSQLDNYDEYWKEVLDFIGKYI